MAPPKATAGTKRPAGRDPTISPPPLKRKAQSTISKSAVANFFTPTSQKPKERTTWSERSPKKDTPATLLVAKYVPESEQDGQASPPTKRRKIAAFDLDSTLITTASNNTHAKDASDWKWWHHSVPGRLRELYEKEGYRVVIFTNQGGLTLHADPKAKTPKSLKDRVPAFKQKCNAILNQLKIPLTLYAATANDVFRKPRTGMWKELCDDYGLANSEIDHENSIFVGDAGGRLATLDGKKKDFSCSDRNLAHNVGIRYQTPEEFFLGESAREFTREFDLSKFPFTIAGQDTEDNAPVVEKTNKKDIILFVGSPGAGKSTFYQRYLKPLGYERVNQDTLGTREKCFKAAGDFLSEGDSIVIDNTNPDPNTRGQWVSLARKFNVPIRCVWFKTPVRICEHNDMVRAMNDRLNPESRKSLPKLAFNTFASKFKEPKPTEGFQDIVEVDFKFRGTEEEYGLWGRYWL
ncbi:Polynucleotide kinase 3 phosphatase domain containing protein [Naviculisporaceae sp. PSN 640]